MDTALETNKPSLFHPRYWWKSFKDGLSGCHKEISNIWHYVAELPLRSRRLNAIATGLVSGSAIGLAWTFNHMMGLAAVASNLVIMRLSKNDQKTALFPVRNLLILGQNLMTGTDPATVTIIAATIRSAVASCLPQSEHIGTLRKKIGIGYACALTGVQTIMGFYKPWYEIVFITGASLLATAADFVKASHTRCARILRVVTGLIGAPAFAHGGNFGGAAVDASTAVASVQMIRKNDIPRQDENGRRISWKEGIKVYREYLIQAAHGKSCQHRVGLLGIPGRVLCFLKKGPVPDQAVPGIKPVSQALLTSKIL